MAVKRMFSSSVTETDSFLELPLKSQALYFHLGMQGDDDGFVANPRAIIRSIGWAIWKMLRKKGCVPSALTQNVKDFLASPEIENIFENSDFLVLLSQAQGDRQILAKQLGISPHQLSYVTHTNSGEGLLFFGNTTIPFVDRFPQNTELYAIMTTRPEDKKQEMNRA